MRPREAEHGDDVEVANPPPADNPLLVDALPRLLHQGDGSPSPWPVRHVDPAGLGVPLHRVRSWGAVSLLRSGGLSVLAGGERALCSVWTSHALS